MAVAVGAIFAGGVAGPVLLMFGLRGMPASGASLPLESLLDKEKRERQQQKDYQALYMEQRREQRPHQARHRIDALAHVDELHAHVSA
jgi:hypothetical protein